MFVALLHPELVERLVVVDIAPKGYGSLERFEGYIGEMQRLPLAQVSSRGDAEARFEESDPGVKAFLLQNLRRDGQAWRWQVNLDLIAADAALGTGSRIADWPEEADALPPYEGPVLWVAGGESRYVKREDGERMGALPTHPPLHDQGSRSLGAHRRPRDHRHRPAPLPRQPHLNPVGPGHRVGQRWCRGIGQRRRRPRAQAVSSWRELSCSLRSTELTWVSTVLTEMKSSLATSLYW